MSFCAALARVAIGEGIHPSRSPEYFPYGVCQQTPAGSALHAMRERTDDMGFSVSGLHSMTGAQCSMGRSL